MSLRHAKDLFESTAKMERELKHLFNGTCKYHEIEQSQVSLFLRALFCPSESGTEVT